MTQQIRPFLLVDIAGASLSPKDVTVLSHPGVFGVILFARNYQTPQQLRQLCRDIHRVRPECVIFADQEGGRIQRFADGFTELLSMAHWGQQYDDNPSSAYQGLVHQTTHMVLELQDCGVQVSLVPVLDLQMCTSKVIGSRSFHRDPMAVSRLAASMIGVMHQLGMPCIGKHFPGHGGVAEDSHIDLPHDRRAFRDLWHHDLYPYRYLLEQLDAIMPAHIVFDCRDTLPAGFSSVWLQQVLRREQGYTGLVISDDLLMGACASYGTVLERAEHALAAGCDVLTVCNARTEVFRILDALTADSVGQMGMAQQRFLSKIHTQRRYVSV